MIYILQYNIKAVLYQIHRLSRLVVQSKINQGKQLNPWNTKRLVPQSRCLAASTETPSSGPAFLCAFLLCYIIFLKYYFIRFNIMIIIQN